MAEAWLLMLLILSSGRNLDKKYQGPGMLLVNVGTACYSEGPLLTEGDCLLPRRTDCYQGTACSGETACY